MNDVTATESSGASDEELAAFEGLATSILSDAMDALQIPTAVIDPRVQRVAGTTIVGRARTICRRAAPSNATQADFGSELGNGTQQVIDSSEPGSVIVIASGDDISVAVWGGLMGTRAHLRGAVGLVTDGAIRDRDEMQESGLGIFASAAVSRQAVRRMVTLSIDQPIVCGGVRVCPGDIVVGDGDGVVVVPQSVAAKVAAKAREMEAVEDRMVEFLRDGNTLVAAVATYKQR